MPKKYLKTKKFNKSTNFHIQGGNAFVLTRSWTPKLEISRFWLNLPGVVAVMIFFGDFGERSTPIQSENSLTQSNKTSAKSQVVGVTNRLPTILRKRNNIRDHS